MVLNSFKHSSRSENNDLFNALSWSLGALGFIVKVELRIKKSKKFIRLRFEILFSSLLFSSLLFSSLLFSSLLFSSLSFFLSSLIVQHFDVKLHAFVS